MATRTTPTERQKRLGAELRKMRLAAGRTTEYAAGLLGIDRTRLSNMESGIRPFSPERIRTLACNYACADARYADALVDMAENKERGWWEKHRGTLPSGLLDIAELEWHAARVRTVQVMHVPGLLQTEEYARAVFAAVLPPLSRLEIELRVTNRMDRQQVFDRRASLPYVAYVHEAALRMPFGGAEVTRQQLVDLAARSEHESIDVRIVPNTAGGFPGAGHALLHADGPVPQLDTVQLDSAHGPEFTHAEAQLTKYRSHLDWMDEASLPAAASRDLIHKVAREH
ncbi:helix-turn-helix transcriptional regulator [Streptomyces sp. NPDC050658]|uniref:helix-turn-helix domain-containing protein n=1 Tax=unclassified Streptomyces TaxID=2593676 RepID=UPI00341458E1